MIADLLTHALDLRLQNPRLFKILRALGDFLADALQHRQRGFQAVGQIAQRVAVSNALLAFAAQQTVERVGQAQQFAGVFFAEAFPRAGFHLIQLLAHTSECAQAPCQSDPEQNQQHQQRAAEAQIELFPQPGNGFLILAHRLQGDDAVGGVSSTEQFDLDVINEKFFAIGLTNLGELGAAPVIARLIVDGFVLRGPGTPHQLAGAIIDVTEQAAVRQAELLTREQGRHQQPILFDPSCGNQRRHVRRQAFFDGAFQRQTEGALQRRQHQQHEDDRQSRGGQHQPNPQRSDHRQRSVNR